MFLGPVCDFVHVNAFDSHLNSFTCLIRVCFELLFYLPYFEVPTKYRCDFTTANNGLGEELSHADIEKCIRAEERKKRLERRSVGEPAITQADINAEDETFGAVAYKFKRMFDGVWFDGVVVKILDTGTFFTSSMFDSQLYLSSFLIL